MFMYYEKEQIDSNTIVLRKCLIDLEKHCVEMLQNGDIILKGKNEVILIDDVNSEDFNFSKIHECLLCEIMVTDNNLNYTSILKKVYQHIGDATKIIKNTTLSIVVSCKTDKGYTYMQDLGISFQRCDANKTLKEIMLQCQKERICIKFQIKLSDDKLVQVSHAPQ